MADEQEQQPENEINPARPNITPEAEYLQISEMKAAKTVELPPEGGQGPKTLTESMDDATDLTDMQFAAKNMFPRTDELYTVQVARVASEAFLSLLQFRLTNEIMTTDPSKPIDVGKVFNKNYRDLTIGLDGEGRIDYAKLLGAAREIKKEESLVKGL